VFRGAAELGYRPDTAAQVLRRTRSRHLGVLFSLQQPYEVDLAEAIYPAAERRGYHVVLGAMTAGRDERQAVEELLSFRSEAIILIAPTSGRQQLARLGQQIPLIEIGRRLTGDGGVDVVRVADERGAQQAVDHLVALGHRDIVHVGGARHPGAADRRRGYRQAMRRHHLQDHIRILPGDYTEESGAQAARTLLQADKLPSAIFAANDRCAHGVIATLSRAGLDIPNDLSVVGYDDSRIARLSFVDLTTIRQDATQMAELAVEAAAQRLDEGRTTARDIVVKPTLIVRGSTGPARP
jgi:DNA-binding LacI/PurR family transcriptional regulator